MKEKKYEKLNKKIRNKQLEFIFRDKEYKEMLKNLSYEIKAVTKTSANERTTENCFEFELFSFIKNTLGLRYYPEKEYSTDLIRHKSKGRIDSKIGCFIIEFKHESKFKTESQINYATNQLEDYLKSLYSKEKMNYLGAIIDGQKIRFVKLEDGKIMKEKISELNHLHLDRIIKSIVLLDKVALTAENLVKDFSIMASSNVTRNLCDTLFNMLMEGITPKSVMLFNEWKELFRLAHDDSSKQKPLEERRESLENIFSTKLKTNEEEYKALFALQTSYAILVKLIAFKVISKIKFKKDLLPFNEFGKMTIESLRIQMDRLEDGEIFRKMGINNLLEGDFFSWYSSDEQWNDEIFSNISDIFSTLSKYEDKAIFNEGDKVQDLFRNLYQEIIPDKVRHSLGEYYTPSWLADHVVREAIKTIKQEKWKGMDPCTGSGTFTTTMISLVLEENRSSSETLQLKEVLSRVKAIDLNPLGVLTSRINYFINISHLIDDEEDIEIPVYLGDSSYVPENVVIEGIDCVKYSINTLKGEIEIKIPKSAISNENFSNTMIDLETYIEQLDEAAVFEQLYNLIPEKDKNDTIKKNIESLSCKLVDLERNSWNGIWARIITNFLITSNIGEFDIIVGNPPWVDWKNLPSGYRERIKGLCLSKDLFSGDKRTGGISLNICALISNVSASNWLKEDGCLSFLMPKGLIYQPSYEGFRNFYLDSDKTKRLYLQRIVDWTKSGHPFNPVKEEFLTYTYNRNFVNYKDGIEVEKFILKKGKRLSEIQNHYKFADVESLFEKDISLAKQTDNNKTALAYGTNEELSKFEIIAGVPYYKGRQGVEAYPQEVFLLETEIIKEKEKEKIYFKNFQGKKSKYKVPQQILSLETDLLYPVVKGTDVGRFNLRESNYIAPFPYEDGEKFPIIFNKLMKKSPKLAKYLSSNKKTLDEQTEYNRKIIGKSDSEFYSYARVGSYTYAPYFVAFRDNSKWEGVVVSEIDTIWGGVKRPLFQKHATTISQDVDENFISFDEAHYICAIINAPIVVKYILNSQSKRGFKATPPIKLPKFDKNNELHWRLRELSILAHEKFDNEIEMSKIDIEIDEIYLRLCELL